MGDAAVSDTWEQGSPYERYVGRWSRAIAPDFLDWLALPEGLHWLDVGCGTGALCAAILDRARPQGVVGVDPSDGFLQLANRYLGERARLHPGSAAALPVDSGTSDAVVSGLVLNFLPDLPAALAEMRRALRPGGTVAAYVWDYADRMEVIRCFWDVAQALDPAAAALHEGRRFPLCRPEALAAAFAQAGLTDVQTAPLGITATFAGFDDYWQPFLGGQGPAPAYAMSLSEDRRAALEQRLRAALPCGADGRIALRAGAWAVRGIHRAGGASLSGR